MDTDSASEEARFEGAPLQLRPPNVQLDDLESRLEDQGRLIREQWASIAVLGNHIQEAEAGTSPRCTSCLFLGSSLAAAFAGGAISRRCGHFASPVLANSAADRGRGGLRTGGRRSLPVHGAGGVSLELVDGRSAVVDMKQIVIVWPPASAAGFTSTCLLAVRAACQAGWPRRLVPTAAGTTIWIRRALRHQPERDGGVGGTQ